MFEAQTAKGGFWKKIVDAMKDLVNEANFECTPNGISIQSVDSSHVALVSLQLHQEGFGVYQCHRQQILGVNLTSLSKLLKITDDKDAITLRHQEDCDTLTILADDSQGKKCSEYQLKLMEIEGEAMGVPDELEYKAILSMPADLFAKICKDMSIFGDTLTVDITKERVKFSGTGDLGDGHTTIASDGLVKSVKSEIKTEIKREVDENAPLAERFAPDEAKKSKTNVAKDGVYITCTESMQLSFALRYLSTFSKGSTLADRVELCLARDSPCRVEYDLEGFGKLRWFLAPKVDENEA